MNYDKMGLLKLAAGLRAGDFTSVELTNYFLNQIEAKDKDINAFITVTAEQAIAQAEDVDARLQAGHKLPALAGIPFALKDNICTKGILTSGASKMLAEFIPTYDAFVWIKLREQKAVLLGKTNLDEFALGSSTESSYFGATKNPLDQSRVSGGSSGGSAAAVAAGEAAFTLGSDTGGSVRQPAAYCGLVGMRPTYGLVSRRGVIAMASSMDQVGPLTRSIHDNAQVLQAIAGYDKEDTVSEKREPADFAAFLGQGVKGLRVGLTKSYLDPKIRPEFKEIILEVAEKLKQAGAQIINIDVDGLDAAVPSYYLLSSAEVSSNLGRYDGIHYGYRSPNYSELEDIYYNSRSEGFGDEVKRRIVLGTFALSAGYYDKFYVKAQKIRSFVKQELAGTFRDVDLILAPMTPDIAPKLGEKKNKVELYANQFFSVLAPLAGLPALSLPSGKLVEKMPVAVQLIGKPFSEALLYQVGDFIMEDVGEEIV